MPFRRPDMALRSGHRSASEAASTACTHAVTQVFTGCRVHCPRAALLAGASEFGVHYPAWGTSHHHAGKCMHITPSDHARIQIAAIQPTWRRKSLLRRNSFPLAMLFHSVQMNAGSHLNSSCIRMLEQPALRNAACPLSHDANEDRCSAVFPHQWRIFTPHKHHRRRKEHCARMEALLRQIAVKWTNQLQGSRHRQPDRSHACAGHVPMQFRIMMNRHYRQYAAPICSMRMQQCNTI